MDNIMKRFKCFNTIMQNNSSTDDDDKEEEGEDAEKSTSAQSEDKVEIVLPKAAVIDPEFADTGFWKNVNDDLDIDDLLADYDWASWPN